LRYVNTFKLLGTQRKWFVVITSCKISKIVSGGSDAEVVSATGIDKITEHPCVKSSPWVSDWHFEAFYLTCKRSRIRKALFCFLYAFTKVLPDAFPRANHGNKPADALKIAKLWIKSNLRVFNHTFLIEFNDKCNNSRSGDDIHAKAVTEFHTEKNLRYFSKVEPCSHFKDIGYFKAMGF